MTRTLRIISRICRIFFLIIVKVSIFISVIRIYETENNNRPSKNQQLMLLYTDQK